MKHNHFILYFIRRKDSLGNVGDNKHTSELRWDVDVDNRRPDIQVEAGGWREQDDHILHRMVEVEVDTLNNRRSLELQLAET